MAGDMTEYRAEREEGSLSDVFEGVVHRLREDAKRRVQQRQPVEERWVVDLAYFEGNDDNAVVEKLLNEERSTAVVNVTRSKANTFESKLRDMMFPTDDRNWAVDPTPVPESDQELRRLNARMGEVVAAANAEEDDAEAERIRSGADPLAVKIKELESKRQEARQQANMMTAEIDDNLVECEYEEQCAGVIHDAVTAGTGFLKGPVPLNERVRKNWIKDDAGRYRLRMDPESPGRFAMQHVSYWNVFPNTGCRQFDQARDWMERHIMTERDLRDFAQKPGVDKNAVRRLLQMGPQETLPQYMMELDVVASDEESSLASADKFFMVWEYRGPLEIEEMEEVMAHLLATTDGGEGPLEVEIDPLTQMDAVMWFCEDEVLKVGINHMDDNACVYNVFQIEKSKARLWAPGIPFLMRTQASIINDAWRLMLDNAEWAGFPILEINSRVLQPPEEGDFVLRPRAAFERQAGAGDAPGIVATQIPIHQEQYAAIIEMAMSFLDTETNVSVLTSGEQGGVTKTAGGMALLMNAVNVVFRRVVKLFDDGITKPVITKSYYYLMQFSPKEEIKGDYAVKARGSSVLLVREVQAQNMLVLVGQIAQDPVLGKLVKHRELMKKLLQSMMIASDEILLTEDELEELEMAEAEAAANAPPEPEVVKLQLDRENSMRDAETRITVAAMERETKLIEFATRQQISLETAAAHLQGVRETIASNERKLAAEVAVDSRKPEGASTAGGYV